MRLCRTRYHFGAASFASRWRRDPNAVDRLLEARRRQRRFLVSITHGSLESERVDRKLCSPVRALETAVIAIDRKGAFYSPPAFRWGIDAQGAAYRAIELAGAVAVRGMPR